MKRINPFSPNSPVNPGTFVGRLEELERLETSLLQAAADNPTNFVITGERGIGKTSLLSYIKHVATGRIPIENRSVSFLVVDTDIDSSTTQRSLIKKIQQGIKSQLAISEAARSFLKEAWSFLQRVEVAGTKIAPESRQEEEELLADEFSYSFSDLVNRICGADTSLFGSKYEGVLILIDEADNAGDQLRLGSFLKLLLERLQRRDCRRVLIGLAGLPTIRNVLVRSHPSSLRLFQELPLERLSEEEVKRVVRLCLKESNRLNNKTVQISEQALETLAFFAEGYPHFIQQFGYCAFGRDNDDSIDIDDVVDGAIGKGGALELIGDRYYRDNFYNKIQAESYRQVLRIMAESADGWVTKKEIRSKFRGENSTLDNAIKALRDREIILSKEGAPGVYRLQHRGFAWWIKMYTTAKEETFRSDLHASLPIAD